MIEAWEEIDLQNVSRRLTEICVVRRSERNDLVILGIRLFIVILPVANSHDIPNKRRDCILSREVLLKGEEIVE